MEESARKSHNMIVEERKKFTLTGVTDVISFDEETIMLETSLGRLAIKGEDLHLGQFDTEKGDISGSGLICAVIYTTSQTNSGFLSRLFK